MGTNINKIDQSIHLAKQSKQSFIQFINDIEITQVAPWVNKWLNERWTDNMSKVFFESFWNGSLDAETLYLSNEELPSIVDDIEKCMRLVS